MAETKKKILIIEDDQMIGSMYKIKIDASGYTALLATDGPSGLETAKKEDPDMIFLDVILPLLDGFSVLEELKKSPKTKKIPVILLTNLGTEEDIEKGKKLGAMDYLVKANLTPADVVVKISQYLK